MKEAKGASRALIMVGFSIAILLIVIAMFYYSGSPLVRYGIVNLCWGRFTSQVGELKAATIYMGEHKEVDVDLGTCVLRLWFVNRDTLGEIERVTGEIEAEIEKDYGRKVDIKEKIMSQCNKENEENKGFIIASPWFGEAPEIGGVVTWVLIGAAVGGFVGPGGGEILGKLKIKGVPLIPVLKAGAVGWESYELHGVIKDFFERLEEWGKTAICYPLKKEFATERFIPEKGINETGKIESIKGSYCLTLYKGRERYYIDYFEGKCKDNTENINQRIEDFREEDEY